MPFDVRCPECRAKLRLPEEPAADEAVECPKCGSQFDLTSARMGTAEAPAKKKKRPDSAGGDAPAAVKTEKKKKKKGKAPPADAGLKKVRSRKQKSNKTVLFLMLGGALVILTCISLMAYFLLSKSGKMEELLTYVPGDCNIVRGVNTGTMSRYLGYKNEMSKAMNAGGVQDAWDDIAKSLSLPAEEAATPDYAVVGKRKQGGTGVVMVFRTRKAIDPGALAAALGGAATPAGTFSGVKVNRSGALQGAVVYAPTNRLIVVVPAGPQQNDMLAKSAGGKANPETAFASKLGKTGERVSSGHIWAIVRPTGDLQNYMKDLVKPVTQDFKTVTEQAEKTPMFGMWTTFGAKMIFGMGFECDSPETAKKVCEYMREGPLGKGEDQPTIPNTLTAAYGTIKSKEFSEFLSNLKYYSSGECVYMQSRMNNRDKATNALNVFANPNLADMDRRGGGGPGVGGPGG